ncbi:MAG TPA: tetratricopeptide repeat protein [Gemmatimonadaceae bacterium]|nr:tetratricopeptide repeat protein [Gemmatimonadaceae bacterium]
MTGPSASNGHSAVATERWNRIEALLHQALDIAPVARNAFIDAATTDGVLRAELHALLAAHGQRGVLDRLVDEVMTPILPSRAALADATISLPAHSRYRIIGRVGGGGMGVVYRARDERLERDIALKFLSPHLSTDEVAKRRFLVEARAAAAIEHPNICTVHEIGDTEDGQLYIVMACYDGETLDRHIARGPLPLAEALRIAGEMSRGLGKAHDRGIVHRDIKPANVMITSDGLVKILDFGIAKLTDVALTQTVGAIGTVAYMSPEQAFGETVDHRTDIWSLGVVLYEMLSGVRPFRGPGEQAVLVAALASEPEPVGSLRPGIPKAVDDVIRRAIAKRAEDRFANAAELLSALAACAPTREGDAPAARGGVRSAAEPNSGESPGSTLTRGGERRQATVVACTLDGMVAIYERLSPDDAERVLVRVRECAEQVAGEHGGLVNHFSGDDLVLLFGVPIAHEDDAVRATRAAMAMRTHVTDIAAQLDARLAAGLRIRAGIHVGPVVAQQLTSGDHRFRIAGAAADVATRLASAADAGAILLSPEARRLVAPFVHTEVARAVAMHGDSDPVTPHRVVRASDVRSRLEGAALAGLTPFVGRARELSALEEQCASGCEGAGCMMMLIGEAGAGKSRLLHELRLHGATLGMRILIGRCDAYGATTPFLPFIDAVSDAFALPQSGTVSERHEAIVAAVRAVDGALEQYLPLYLALLAVPSEAHPVPEHLRGEAFEARMLEALSALFTLGARTAPTLLLLEDWHWADEASRGALRALSELIAAFPISLVVTSRPEGAGEWSSSEHHRVMHLAPLDSDASTAIACAVLRASVVEPDLLARLHERTGGNAFFLEEVCAVLVEEGAVVVQDGVARLSVDLGAFHVPETVQGVLRTRIDRLPSDARDVLRVAAVIGREFTRGVLEDVVQSVTGLVASIDRLKASGLVQQVGVVPEPSYRFKHALTQEVAYDSLLEHQRARLHAQVGSAIEIRHATRLDEQAERLAYHFGMAEDWPRAVQYCLLSAERATDLSRNAEALDILERAQAWIAMLRDDVQRRELLADVMLRQERLCEALGLRERQLAIVEALIALLAPFGPSRQLAQVYQRQGDAFTLLHRYDSAERSLETSLRLANERHDQHGERSALRSIAFLRSHAGRHEEALEKIEQVLTLNRAMNDTRAEAGDLATLGNILRALGRPEHALQVLQTAFERTVPTSNPARYGYLLNVIATVHRDLGRLDEALALFARTADYMSVPHYASFTLPCVAHIHLQQGRTDQALATYREAVELTRKAGYVDGLAAASRALGEVLVGLEQHAGALPHLREAAVLFAQLQDQASELVMLRHVAVACEALQLPADAHATWARLRDLHRSAMHLAGAADAAEGMARAERQLPDMAGDAIAHYEEAIGLAARLGDRKRELAARNALGIVHFQRAAYADALRQYEAALRACRESGDRVHEGLILNSLGATLHQLHRWDEARTVLDDSVRITAASGELQLQAHAFALLGDVCLAAGRLDEARMHVERSQALRQQLGDRRGEGWMLERLARIDVARGDPDSAVRCALEGARFAVEVGDVALERALAALSLVPSSITDP